MFAYCISAAYQEAAFRAASQAPRCASRRAPKGAVEERIHRGAGSGASTDVLREIGAPCREIGVELDVYPHGKAAGSGITRRTMRQFGCEQRRLRSNFVA